MSIGPVELHGRSVSWQISTAVSAVVAHDTGDKEPSGVVAAYSF